MKVNENRLKHAFYSSLSSSIYQIVVIICGFITSRLIIQTYGSSWNGIIASITKYLGLFSIVEIGINGSTRVALYKAFAQNNNEKISAIINANDRYYKRISVVLIGYVLILIFIAPLLCNTDINYSLISYMVLILGVSKFAENCWGINSKILLAASQSNYITNIAQTLSVILNAVLLIIIIINGGSILWAKAGSSIILVIVPISLFLISRHIFHINKRIIPDDSALKGRKDVLANSLSNVIHENVDIFFMTILCPSTELSVYGLYYVVADGLTKVFQIITNGLEAGFGNMWTRGEIEALKKHLYQFEFIMCTLSVLLFGCMAVMIVPFMSIYTSGITDANYLRFSLGLCIAIAQVFMSVRTPYILIVQAAGHYKQVKIGAYMEAGINIVFTWVLVMKIGIIGAIIGTIIANIFRTVQYGWYVSKHMINRRFRCIILRMVWIAITFSVSVCLSEIVIYYIDIENWLSWISTASIVFMIHSCVLVIASLICYKDSLVGCFTLFKRIIKK